MQIAREFGDAGSRARKLLGTPLFNFMRSYHPGTLLFCLFLVSLLIGTNAFVGAAFMLCIAYLFLWRAVDDIAVQAHRADVNRLFSQKWKNHDARFIRCAWQTYCKSGAPVHLQIYHLRLRQYQQEYGELPESAGDFSDQSS